MAVASGPDPRQRTGIDTLAADISRALARLLTELRPGEAPVAPDTELRTVGLDSMTAARLWIATQGEFGIDVPLTLLADAHSLADFGRQAAELAADRAPVDGAAVGAVVADPERAFEPFPLTPLQEAYLTAKEPALTEDAVGCHLYREFEVGGLDAERLRNAWERLVAHHDMLRAVVTPDGRQRIQAQTPQWSMPVSEPVAGHPDRDFEARAARTRARMSHRRFEAGEWPLFAVEVTRRADGRARVHLGIDALVTDGAGLDLLTAQWKALYDDPARTPATPELTARDCLVALAARTDTPGHRRSLDHWVHRLAELPGAPGPVRDTVATRPEELPCLRRTTRSARLAAEEWRAVRERAAGLGVTATALVLTLFTEVLARHGAHRPFSLTVTTSRRALLPAAADQVVGPFTGTVAVEAVLPHDRTFEEAARLTHQELWKALEHSAVCGVTALRASRARGGAAEASPVVFTSMLDAAAAARGRGFADDLVHATSQTSGVWLDHQMWERDGGLELRWDVADEMFEPGVPDAAFASLHNGLRVLADSRAEPEHRPLNELQQAYFVARAAAEPREWSSGQVYLSFETAGSVDLVRLETALVRLMNAYEVLRSAVTVDGRIAVRPDVPEEWAIPVTGRDSAERVREAMTANPFPLGRWPQFDLRVTEGEEHDTVHLCVDLTLADAHSIHAVGRELMRLYARPRETPRTGAPHAEHAREVRDRAAAPERDAWRAHWRDALAELPPGPSIGGRTPGAGPSSRIRLAGSVPGRDALAARAARHGLTPDAVLLTAFLDTLSLRHEEDFAVPVVRWDGPDGKYRPGEFTALSWVSRAPRGLSFTERARTYHRALEQDAPVPTSGLAELRRRTAATGATGHRVVYTSVLDLTDRPLPATVRQGEWRSCTPDVSLDCITTADDDGTLRYCWDAVAADFDGDTLAELFAAYGRTVTRLVDSDEPWDQGAPEPAPAAQGPSAAELHRILHEWNDTAHPFDGDRLVHTAFEEQARLAPDAVALRWRGGTMTYRELNRRANRLARELLAAGTGPETVVAVSVPRGPLMIAAVLGVLKAGGVYLPIEPHLPGDRAAVILEEADCTTVVTTSDRAGWAVPDGVAEIRADRLPPSDLDPDADPEPTAEPYNTAYIIFTSGSTGRPKGVAVAHRPVLNLLNWCRRTFAFDASDLGLCVTSLGFDLSVFDVFGLLGHGAGLYIADAEQQRDPALLLDVLLTEPVTFWNSAPTTLAQIGPLLAEHRGAPGTRDLRLVFLSGDYTPLSLPDEVRAVFPAADLISLGGATEATVWSNWFRIGEIDPEWRSIPYGKPIDNCRYHVLDENRRPCPVGVEGDLYIGGECLALGYVNQPELTSQRFIPDPLHDDPAERLYHTGDRASYFPDGNLCFHGRSDGQVKIRGFRVELGEIEHRLRLHPGVKDVVVLARGDAGERVLVAYLVPVGGAAPTARELRAHAAAALPEYMVPNFFGFLGTFPSTANGKLDRNALPWPVPARPEQPEPPQQAEPPEQFEQSGPYGRTGEEPAAAADGPSYEELREEIAGLFASTLGLPQVDAAADLWDQGATSFTMVQVSGALQRRYRRRIPVSVLLDEPKIEAIARWAHRELTGAPAGAGTTPVVERTPAAPAAPKTAAPTAPTAPAAPAAPTAPETAAPTAQAAVGPAGAEGRGPGAVDFFSPEDRARFKAGHWNLRPARPDEPALPLTPVGFDEELLAWRATRRDFLDAPVPYESFCRLLSLLREIPTAAGVRRLHPSAGDTYAVQTYLHLAADAVDGIAEGLYYHDPVEHALRRIDPVQRAGRSAHFVYNREVFDRSRFGIYLVGRRPGIEPMYGEQSLRYLTLEAGSIGQLLMMGQAAAGVGLCPIGALAFDDLAARFGLDEGHVFLQAFLGGAAAHPAATADGVGPVFGARPAPATRPVPPAADAAGTAEPTAVIGMAGRFPGADDLDAFWDNLEAGANAVGPPPSARRDIAPAGSAPVGGFLRDVDRFESLLFRISPEEARTVDPQARLMLQAVWQCLEDAGHTAESLRLSAGRVGVFIGTMWQDHRQQGADHWAAGGPARTPATASDIANRVSHFFDFGGPSLAVDTSCSSSLTALHLAVQSLRRGECGAAVVGAVNLLAHPYHWGLLEGLELVALDGTPEAFSAAGSGWYPGEGVGALLLRPAGAAAEAGDLVHGTVEETRIAHAGRAPRYGAPRAESLVDSLARALAGAGVTPDDIDYVECAAAGAGIADAAELEALGEVFARPDDAPRLPVGTVKPNIGHLEAASGLSQVIKVLLQMRHGRIAPTRTARQRNGLVDWQTLPVEVVERSRPWTPASDGRVTALVNALGATGSYGHVVLRSAPGDRPAPAPATAAAGRADGGFDPGRVLLLSADGAEQLGTAARRLGAHLAAHADTVEPDRVAWTLQTGRVHLSHRLALTAGTAAGMVAGLNAFLAGRSHPGLSTAVADPAAGPAPTDRPASHAVDLWLRGHPVDWARLWPAPGRRVTLPVHAFAGDRHVLDDRRPLDDAAPVPGTAVADAVSPAAQESAERYLAGLYAEVSGIPVERLHPKVPLENYGLTSMLVSRLNSELRAAVGPVSQTVFYEYPDLAGVAAHLLRLHDGPWHGGPAGRVPVPVTEKPVAEKPAAEQLAAEPIAVVGIAGRYPQAADLDQFWRNLEQGRDSVTALPADRPAVSGGADLMRGGFLAGVDRFDPLLFGITPRDARLMDPQERLFLETAWETLEDAGYTRARLRERHGAGVGVFVGTMYNEYPFFGVESSLSGEPADSGSAVAGIANRVSYFLDVHGPSMAVDTMCSSSLTALHLAVQSLRRGECAAALVGGVNLSLHPHKFRQQARLRMTSSDHRCRSFGAGGDGFAPAEGVGALLIKPLSAAVADGDRIHAVIRGTAVNHGGRTNGYMVPNPVAQGALVRAALDEAGVDPAGVGYLEAHGTGTSLGDPIEINGLARAFAGADLAPGSCAVGSVKSNIGHPEAAAGLAGLTKVVLQLRHRRLVPSLHSRELNPAVDWAQSPFRVVQELEPWAAPVAADGTVLPRRAGVSSFGAGGSNAHVVVEEYVPAGAAAQPSDEPGPGPELIVLSAFNEERLRAVAGRLADRLRDGGGAPPPALADVAHTLLVGREALRERLAVVVADTGELLAVLDRFAAGHRDPEVLHGRTPGDAPRTGTPVAPDPGLPRAEALRRLAARWMAGDTVDRDGPGAGRLVSLPSYPFAGERHWLPAAAAPTATRRPEPAPAFEPPATPQPDLVSAFEPSVARRPDPAPAFEPSVARRPDLVSAFEPSVARRPDPAPAFEPPATPQPDLVSAFEPSVARRPDPAPAFEPSVARRPDPAPAFEPPVTRRPDPVSAFEPSVARRPDPVSAFEPPVARRPDPAPAFEPPVTRQPDPVPAFVPAFEPSVTRQPDLVPASELPATSPADGVALFTPVWTPTAAAPEPGPVTGRVVCVFTDRTAALADALAARLGADRLLLVRQGADAAAGAEALVDEAAADRIAADLVGRHEDIVGLVDLCDVAAGEGTGRWTDRLRLLQRLVRLLRARDLRVLQVTEGLYGLPGAVPAWSGARLAGFVRMLAAEHPRVAATVADIQGAGGDPAAAARRIHAELLAADGLTEVCLRGTRRYRRELTALPGGPDRLLRLDPDRAYLVTGGTRGIGAAVARLLVRRGARLLALTGRRPLPPRTEWPALDPGSPEGETAALVAELESVGARVLVHTGELGREDRTAAFLAEVRGGLGPLGGVVHCAGRGPLGRPSFAGKSVADIEAVLEPKATGLETLARLCSADDLDFFVLFSSLSAMVPALARGVSDYAAANAFLDQFADHRAAAGERRFRSVDWPTWHETGMGAAQPEGCAVAGVGSLGEAEGLRLLERIVALPPEVARVVVCPPLDGVPVTPDTLLGKPRPTAPHPASHPAPPTASHPVEEPPAGASPLPPVEPTVPEPTVRALEWLAPLFSDALAIPAVDLDPTAFFGDLGVESVMLGELVFRIEERAGSPVEPTALLEHPTLERLAAHLDALGIGPREEPEAAAPQSAVAAQPAPQSGRPGSGRVAVIGLACRFPGAPDAEAFWRNLVAGECSVTEVPASRWDVRRLYRPEYAPGRSISKWGGFVEGIEDFDPEWFGMTEDEATCLDPTIRLFLESAATCLADAGYREEELAGRDVGVFAGARLTGYGRRARSRPGGVGMGSDQNFIAARVAHRFDFHGPNLVVDTACSSSLVALQAACRSLLAGESELAVVGGVDVLLDEEPYLDFSAARALSRTGRCATFDERADGFVPGEGCGTVLLKPLEQALRDGDRVHAVIEAVAVNNDGRTMGLTTPNPVAQAKVIRRALADSGLSAESVGMIEAHGTGTMIGDPIELRALTDAFRPDGDRTGYCAVGSVKSNVGHLLSAAGMAGFLKTVLALREGVIPPTLFCERPNPRFDFAASPFFPNRTVRAWTGEPGRPRYAAVSAFGLGGTNAHVIAGSLAPDERPAGAVRPALPAPVFRRRRLWLDPEPAASAGAPAPRPSLTTSLLAVDFARPASADRSFAPANSLEGKQR
ncbi:non-ribosomal peptide synthetase [Kitasatospora sp. CB02891]|uniref:non-ribosomal peptide synthetase n=1 Tax=Kitasatospora sp. CB02891 TaxID=2020329 RepID=UPI0018E27C0D|nr:non-ribosomal peptide synthetase [Kitasatospora sp. CB02891]